MQSNRREFLVATGGAAALSLTARSRGAQAGSSPNERGNVGFIGLGGQGRYRLDGFMKQSDVNVAALCDVDESHLRNAAGIVEKARGQSPATFGDFRKLLERKDVDAVCIATPDHWHALTTIQACQAGKDVFVEKPLCHSIAEGRVMLNTATKHARITQLGNHIHNDYPNYRRVVELVRSGILGKIDRVHCWTRSPARGIGNPPDGTPPKELDYDFWLGPAPKRAYNPNRSHGQFRYFWDYSGGVYIDFWCHITDVVYWALDLKYPTKVEASGPQVDAERTPKAMQVKFEFPARGTLPPVTLHWYHAAKGPEILRKHNLSGKDSNTLFIGSKGMLLCGFSKRELLPKEKFADFKAPEPFVPDSPGFHKEFIAACKGGKPATCCFDYSGPMAETVLLGNVAYRVGGFDWDAQTLTAKGNPAAEPLLREAFRKGWEVEG